MEKCDYCGRENGITVLHCSGCGNSLPNFKEEEKEPKKKSKALAITLALIFGPLGLLYLGLEGLFIVIIVVGLGFFLLPFVMWARSGLAVGIIGRGLCAAYALRVVENKNQKISPKVSALDLLNEAARLENSDLEQAVIKYEEIISKFPNSRAGEEAARAIKTIKNRVIN